MPRLLGEVYANETDPCQRDVLYSVSQTWDDGPLLGLLCFDCLVGICPAALQASLLHLDDAEW